ncbi:structural maintenance of chromosomes protein 5-like [Dendronephthya gigantea]|uniref:structural maintenance of chromosomes protein 5-like n=1 Tax=Dendronephthya gigantea TaxID=151771 RepID=UPI00106C5439|nr:structural maintenance of chromosomes protein 5-like [Dendronephthya gigantea]
MAEVVNKRRKKSSQNGAIKVKNSHLLHNLISENTHYHGSIVRMKLVRFLTYDECEYFPGASLNVILGPNGSGKSSLVCAICLGLAGSPKLLGRADNVGEFVKHGETNGSVELELYNSQQGKGNYIIERQITRENKSTWQLNRKAVPQKAIQDLVSELNIQINNLCQFLPQEKVVEFAKMSPQELLVATEKAVGPPDMWQNHQDLVVLGKKGKDMEASLTEKKEYLEKLQQQNSRLEHEVKRYQEREKHLEKIRVLEKKKPWAEYEELRKQFIEKKQKRDEIKQVIDQTKKQNAPLEKKKNEATKKVQEQNEENRKLGEKGRQAHQNLKNKKEKLEESVDKVKDMENELKGMVQEQKNIQKKITALENFVQGLKNELETLPGPETFQPRLAEINNEGRTLQQQINKIQTDAANLKDEKGSAGIQLKSVKDRLDRLEDKKNQRLEFLRTHYKDTYNAVLWLRENQHKFDNPVHEPIMLLVNMNRLEDAKFLEMVVSGNDMRAFVCETRKDLQLFLSEVRDKQSLRVNAVAPPDTPLASFKPRKTIDQIKRWGFLHYLNELFTAPDAVMRYLCENCRIHEIPLGTEYTDKHADEVIGNSGLWHFYTPTLKYVVKTSRYGNREKSTATSTVKDAMIFSISVDLEQKRRLELEKQEIERTISEIEENMKLLLTADKNERARLEKLRNEKKDLQQKQTRHKTVLNQIESKERSIELKKTEMPDIATEKERINSEIQKLNKERVDTAGKVLTQAKKCLDVSKERVLIGMRTSKAMMEQANVDAEIRQANEQLVGLENEFEIVKEEYETVRKRAKQQLRVAQRATDTPEGSDLSDDYKELFKTYPNTVQEIEDMIHSEKAKADCNYQTNPQVIRDYERRKKEIEELTEIIANSSDEIKNKDNQLESLKERWLTPLNELLARINEKFVGFFRKLQCAGEVSLATGTDQGEENYEKYGVEIKVKFRAKDSLHVLTQFHQSGGEKSVSTILYLMSLQELTKCPFRVVDEINQGMDPTNERKVFELMVETSTRPNTPQHFLMSPKLLPDLHYSDKMTILFVYNGHWMLKHDKWNMRRMIKSASKKLDH